MGIRHLFESAVSSVTDNRGKPAILGKADGTLYYTDPSGVVHRTRVWARVGEQQSNQEVVVDCLRASPQLNMPVRVDHKNGRLAVVDVDDKRAVEFSGGRNGATVPGHAWLHNRLGPDPIFIEGLQYLPLLVTPANTPDLTIAVQGGSYLDDTGALKILDTAVSGSFSAFVPGTGHHFVIVCLDRTDGSIVLVDGSDVTVEDALFGDAVVTAADIEAVSISADYKALAVVLLYAGQTQIKMRDIVKDLRTGGGGGGGGAPGGSDTQLQYNNGGAFGGISDLLYDDGTGQLLFGASTAETTDKLEIHPTAAQDARIVFASDQGVSVANTLGHDYYLADDNDDLVLYGSISIGSTTTTPGGEYGVFKADVIHNGVMRSVLYLDATSGLSFNEDQQDINMIFRSVNVGPMLVVDAGADEVRIGSTTPLEGGVAKFSSSEIVFNEEGANRDFRVEGASNDAMLFVDASANQVIIGKSVPNTIFTDPALTVDNGNLPAVFRRDASTVAGSNQFYNADTTNGNGMILGFSGATTGAGAVSSRAFGWIRVIFNEHAHGSDDADIEIHTRKSGGFSSRLTIGSGIQVGSPTGGDKGTGAANFAADIYKNNSAFTNPDYAAELWATGKIVKHAHKSGARNYRRYSLDEVEQHIKDNFRLPGIEDKPMGIFERGDFVLEKIEELFTHVIELNHKLEAQHGQGH